jgi:hypothetical protein
LGLRGTRLRRIFGPKRDEAEEDICLRGTRLRRIFGLKRDEAEEDIWA